jgi:hypothetical protein
MLRKWYLVSLVVFPCQFGRVHCCPSILTIKTCAKPKPSLSGFGNFYTAKRYFRTQAKDQKWAASMVGACSKGTRENPLLTGGQLSLF